MKARITALPGDGIGPEVVAEGIKVLRAVASRWGHDFEFEEALIGGIAIDTAGSSLPQQTIAACRAADAVLLGAVGGPKWDDPNAADRPERGLLGIRKALGLFANLRPVEVLPSLAGASPLRPELLEGVDLLVVRELTGGIYFGEKRRWGEGDGETASDLCVYTAGEIERIARTAFELARGRRRKLTSVDKANVLETSRLWRRIVSRVGAAEYPDIELEHMLVDSAAMHLMRRPADFDVLVTENMFGDILSDEASMLAGSMGMLPSASLAMERNQANQANQTEHRTQNTEQNDLKQLETRNLKLGLYEPIHGSAPDIAGQGVANPLATILSVAMLLRLSLGLPEEAEAVEAAVRRVVDDGNVTPDIAPRDAQPCSTGEVGDAVVAALEAASRE